MVALYVPAAKGEGSMIEMRVKSPIPGGVTYGEHTLVFVDKAGVERV